MENDLIRRGDALESIMNMMPGEYESQTNMKYDARMRVKRIPAVDAVEVVRCRECQRWTPGEITETDDFEPPKCALYGPMHADDFCSHGQRREDGDE